MDQSSSQKRPYPGQTVYLVESLRWVREAVVRRREQGLYLIQFTDTRGAIRVRADRLYATRAEAEAHLRVNQKPPEAEVSRPGYWHNVPLWMA